MALEGQLACGLWENKAGLNKGTPKYPLIYHKYPQIKFIKGYTVSTCHAGAKKGYTDSIRGPSQVQKPKRVSLSSCDALPGVVRASGSSRTRRPGWQDRIISAHGIKTGSLNFRGIR